MTRTSRNTRQINKKNCMFSAGQHRSTEEGYEKCSLNIWNYYILKFKFDWIFSNNFLSNLDHYFQVLKRNETSWFKPLRSRGEGYLDLNGSTTKFLCVSSLRQHCLDLTVGYECPHLSEYVAGEGSVVGPAQLHEQGPARLASVTKGSRKLKRV